MNNKKVGFLSIDEYIATFPQDVQEKLEAIRATIKAAAPDSEEKISYQMPAFAQKGILVYFAAWKKHIGFYPASIEKVDHEFGDELSGFERTKGAIQFPLDTPLPLELISKIVKFRVMENLEKAENKGLTAKTPRMPR